MGNSISNIVDRQLRRWDLEVGAERHERSRGEHRLTAHPIITVSRQHGSLGSDIAADLAQRFGYTLLHRDVIDRIAESTEYSTRLLQRLDEHARSDLETLVESMFAGKYVDASDYSRGLLKTLLGIARLGGVVVVGRGANFIVGPDRGFHVRVVAPREARITEIARRGDLSPRDAAREVDQVDRDRAEFIRSTFHRSVDDPLGYDLVINSAGLTAASVTSWLADVAHEKFERLRRHEVHTG